jgi:hypothetical protein
MDKPEIIYKYVPFSQYSLRNLKSQSIYFGSPLKFNDPYDCALPIVIKEPTDSEVLHLKELLMNRSDATPEIRSELNNKSTDQLREIITRTGKTQLSYLSDLFSKMRGVSCFSEINNSLLMWSHYGGGYKGFCMAFDTNFEPFSNKLREVRYTNKMPKIDSVSALIQDDFEQWIDLYCVKSKSWEYEKEWRCFHEKEGTMFTYDSSALKAIYFGPDIDRHNLEIICLILAGQNPQVTLWKGKRSEKRFEVLFDQFSYISYSEAVKKGIK